MASFKEGLARFRAFRREAEARISELVESGSRELAEAVAEYSAGSYALLMENHGAIAFGRTLLEAFDRLECLEQSAKLTYLSHSVTINPLDEIRKTAIAAMR